MRDPQFYVPRKRSIGAIIRSKSMMTNRSHESKSNCFFTTTNNIKSMHILCGMYCDCQFAKCYCLVIMTPNYWFWKHHILMDYVMHIYDDALLLYNVLTAFVLFIQGKERDLNNWISGDQARYIKHGQFRKSGLKLCIWSRKIIRNT